MENNGLVGACGLLCFECELYLAREDQALRIKLAKQIQEESGFEIEPDLVTCGGCFSPGNECWSPDCKIRRCCVEVHGITHCSGCSPVPCQTLLQWARESERYSDALKRTVAAHRMIRDQGEGEQPH